MQDDTAINPVTFVEMKASVGSILFLWSSIEREITKRVEELGDGKSRNGAHTLAQKIARWESLQASICAERSEHQDLLKEVRVRLMMALELRNRISHGLIGITRRGPPPPRCSAQERGPPPHPGPGPAGGNRPGPDRHNRRSLRQSRGRTSGDGTERREAKAYTFRLGARDAHPVTHGLGHWQLERCCKAEGSQKGWKRLCRDPVESFAVTQ